MTPDSPLSVCILLCAAASWLMSWARSPSLGPGGMLGDRPSRAWFMDRPLWCAAGERMNNNNKKKQWHWEHRSEDVFSSPHIWATECVGRLRRDVRILSEELSVWAGELDTLLLRWDDGWLPGLLWSSKEGAGDGLSGTRSCNPSSNRNKNKRNISIECRGRKHRATDAVWLKTRRHVAKIWDSSTLQFSLKLAPNCLED